MNLKTFAAKWALQILAAATLFAILAYALFAAPH